MKIFDIDSINKMSLSNTSLSHLDIKPLWQIATDGGNTDTLNCRFHNHAFYELHIIVKGSLVYGFADAELTLGDKEFTVIPPKMRHKVLVHSGDICKYTIAFEVTDESDIASAFHAISGRALPLDDVCKGLFKRICLLCSGQKVYRSEQIYILLYSLLFEIAELSGHAKKSPYHAPLCDDRVFKAKKYIEDNFDIFFSCAEVASYCRISEKQLGRLFIKYESSTLLEYIHRTKLEMIKKMFSEKSDPHRVIAETLGFSSLQYYGKFISRLTGMSPEELRKSVTGK